MTFQRSIVALLIVTIAGLAAAFYIEWRMVSQLRTVKAFVEGHVFAEAVIESDYVRIGVVNGSNTAIVARRRTV